MSNTGKTKALNPEERLQASVARDIKVRQLNEHAKKQADALSVAKWELQLSAKDEIVKRKRMEEQLAKDSEVVKVITTASRRNRLEKLFLEDELKYEEELNMRGLSFTRERV
jgi:formate-dependent phosphoribosylglycinamide formyltransferase (GAR transformylase)